MASQYRKFDQEFAGKDWYRHSLTQILRGYVEEFKTAPGYIKRILHNAAEAVYVHESYIHTFLQSVGPNEPVHPDPRFVRDGYRVALAELVTLLYCKDGRIVKQNDPFVVTLRQRLRSLFDLKLKAWDDEYISREAYYKRS
ncbi:hypothetical protein FRC07_008007 [Ceratobasidium sp. 392]|nr:hypothetical protein FRC07_008007 [Ceratobasidium sp. 392]